MNVNGYEVKDGVLDLRGEQIAVIDSKAFLSARSIRKVLLPKGLSHIGDWAFAKCANLLSVEFEDAHRPGIFGKNVFSGCDNLISISFSDTDDVTSTLLALTANKLPYDHLFRSDDIGQKSWYEKWDISLIARIKKDDAEARMSAALCGEEDISYDGIGSVDGEMPGETGDFIQKEEYDKCSLCYIRLSNDKYLSDATRNTIRQYITDNRFGEGPGHAFFSIFEEGENTLPYLRIYLDTVMPDKDTIKEMIAAIPQKDVYARSYLIKESSSTDDVFSQFLLV